MWPFPLWWHRWWAHATAMGSGPLGTLSSHRTGGTETSRGAAVPCIWRADPAGRVRLLATGGLVPGGSLLEGRARGSGVMGCSCCGCCRTGCSNRCCSSCCCGDHHCCCCGGSCEFGSGQPAGACNSGPGTPCCCCCCVGRCLGWRRGDRCLRRSCRCRGCDAAALTASVSGCVARSIGSGIGRDPHALTCAPPAGPGLGAATTATSTGAVLRFAHPSLSAARSGEAISIATSCACLRCF